MLIFPKTKWLGRQIIYLKETTSTNDLAKQWINNNKSITEGVVFVADMQTEGRGRYERQWFSPGGQNLYMTFVLKPHVSSSELPQLTFPISLALLEACQLEVDDLQLKWPNDLMLHSKKVAGILLELEKGYVIAGIGLNINQKEFPLQLQKIATSLSEATGKPLNRHKILLNLLEKIEKWYGYYLTHGFTPIKELWLDKTRLRGLKARLKNGEEVTLLDLTQEGSLLYEKKNKEKGVAFTGEEICYLP